MKMLVVVAHPDDETFGCGSVLAHAAGRGVETVVACATRGELGEIAPGTGIEPAGLGEAREAELRAAASELGVARVVMLGWRDSGVDGDPAPGSLAATPVDEVAAAVQRVLEAERPAVVVTPDGLDGHRDHVAIRNATLQAVRNAADPPGRVYLWCLPRSVLARFTGYEEMGTPDESVTTIIDTAEHLERRWRAIRKHASQAPPFDAMSPELQPAFLTKDYLQRVVPEWNGGEIERDLFPA
jgi:N-acetyl-1-D-myo-inositol-2-amino-2-deoxy-alpha-D-glucopyranoside deacetylase